MSSSFGIAFAEESPEIKKWEQELNNIKQELKAQDQQRAPISLQEQQKQMNRAWDTVYNLNLAKGNVVHIDNVYTEDTAPKYTSRNSGNSITIRNGDIILIKPKPWEVIWAPIVGSVSHAAIIVDTNKVIDIPNEDAIVRKQSFSSFINEYKDRSDEIIIISMGLDSNQGVQLSTYANSNFPGKPYPKRYEFPFAKYWMHKFYCSSLVWRAHYSSGKYIDLDDNGKSIVFPVELAFSQHTGKVNIIHQ